MQNHNIINKVRLSLLALTILMFSASFLSCKKLVEVGDPKTKLKNSYVFSNDATVTAAVVGMYIHMMENDTNFGSYTVETATGLSADEFTNYSTNDEQIALSTNSLNPFNTYNNSLWSSSYTLIYYANSIIEGLDNAPAISTAVRQQVLGEAKLMRAFCHFYLLNLYGDIPYITTTDYKVNGGIDREPIAKVYPKIVADLLDAQNLLTDNYVTPERVRPNKWAAKAMLARVYLYMGDWPNAEIQATDVINNKGSYNLETNLDKVFLNNSKEAIWQLMPVIGNGFNAWESLNYVLTAVPSSVVLNDHLIQAFENDKDKRKASWISSITIANKVYIFPYKFKLPNGSSTPPTEYCMMFRLAEQYLIKAEALAQQNKLTDAITALDVIRDRADIPLIKKINPNIGKQDLLDVILHERQVELFTEWGHRWLDLKRNNKAGTVLAPIKGNNWQSTDVLYPIPDKQITNDPVMKQNQGYY